MRCSDPKFTTLDQPLTVTSVPSKSGQSCAVLGQMQHEGVESSIMTPEECSACILSLLQCLDVLLQTLWTVM